MRAWGLALVGLWLATASAAAQAPEAPRYEAWTWEARPLPAPRAADTLRRPPDRWLGRDKALHAAGSFLLTLSAQYVLTAKGGADEGDALPFAAGTALFLVGRAVITALRPQFVIVATTGNAGRAVGAAVVMAVVASILPARRLARLEPATAYRGG